ncbi:hypothetical protein LTR04_002826 [Oleoguttula sp. CCFEE 6159]|nr:hypothetical protein LTR04_002826 [Oleoguttula sp. CCFEE 6159]
MYWPIGAPRVYAASKQEPSRCRITNSHDGTDPAPSTDLDSPPGTPTPVIGSKQASPNEISSDGHGSFEQGQSERLQESEPATPVAEEHVSPEAAQDGNTRELIGLRISRSGHIFVTITRSIITVWQANPTAVLASVVRSPRSLETYGPNVSLLLRPDSLIIVVQTSLGYLITYSLATDPVARVYRAQYVDSGSGHARRHSVGGYNKHGSGEARVAAVEADGLREVNIRFRMIIRIDAGIRKALALDDELVVATEKPAAIQCIRWTPDNTGNQTSTELLSRMSWIDRKTAIVEMVHDRPMNLSTWITSDGKAYAIQRLSGALKDNKEPKSLFEGFAFHTPENDDHFGVKVAINARFSLIAIGCSNGNVNVYIVRDYAGHIPMSQTLRPPVSHHTSGNMAFLSYSPDGYCLFAGYERGWMTWSVFGKSGGNSFTADHSLANSNDERWLMGVRDGFWIGGGSEVLLLGYGDERLWILEMARSAVAGCFSPANISRSLLQTPAGFMIYRGYDVPDLTAMSAETALWHNVQIPERYLSDQWPIRSVVISLNGRYVAVAGRRGLAHYSINSGRWKTFDDSEEENQFTVRGGMCWHQHVLLAAVESGNFYQLRLYSREQSLEDSQALHIEDLSAPIICISPSGDDSLLVYTHENVLFHYIVNAVDDSVKLLLVGQIAFHGIIRAPPRRLEHGDPLQDVAVASVIFLVDGKLVLLQPSVTEEGELKYDMRVVAHNVEYFALMRDQPASNSPFINTTAPLNTSNESLANVEYGLRDSLWLFDGSDMTVWVDVQDALNSAPSELGKEWPSPAKIPLDFYPLSPLLDKGIVFGLETDLVQRRDVNFASLRFSTRTHLFLPSLLRHQLSHYNTPAAVHLSYFYQHLPYFAHALEMLLHDVLDEEVDKQPSAENALLPSVLSFLSSFPSFLDIVVQCTRKTELRSWRTLFKYLPSPQDLFEESLQKGSLKTAGGYLLVLHTFEELSSSSQQLIRLLLRAKEEQDWELCKELARFLMALDESGATLREAMEMIELKSPSSERGSFLFEHSRLELPRTKRNGVFLSARSSESGSQEFESPSAGRGRVSPQGDCFSMPDE